MKNAKDMIKDIKNVLGLSEEVKETEETVENTELESNEELEQVELAQMKLENGTIIEAEAFEGGNEVFIVTDDEKIPVPVGEYMMEDGRILVVNEEGIISEMKDAEVEEEVEAEVETEVEAKVEYATKEELNEIKSMVEEIRDMMEKKSEMAKEEKIVAEEEKAELEEQLKEELSKPAVNPVKHNPESQSSKNTVLYGQKRQMTTRDRVFSKIANFNN